MLSGLSWATLRRVFACAMLSQEYYDNIAQRFFMCNVVWCCLDNMAQGFFIYFVQCCPKKIKTTLKKVFLVRGCLQPQGQHYIGFFLWNIVPKVLRQHCTGFFSVQCYLQPLWQHCTRFLPVQCWPKRIKTTLNRIFSCAMLSGTA